MALAIPNSFSANTLIQSSLVNNNFQAIVTWSSSVSAAQMAGLAGLSTGQLTAFATISTAQIALLASGSPSLFGTQTAATFLCGPTSGSAANPTFKTLQVPTRQIFTSSSGTYTTPAGVLYLRVRAVGGGAGGQGSGGSGGSGWSTGSNGVATTFGTSLITCNPGTSQANATQAGLGGTATIGAGAAGIAVRGGDGAGGTEATLTGQYAGGIGGSSAFGGGGAGANTNVTGGSGATNSGAGGGGSGTVSTLYPGGGGGAGGYVDAIIVSPSATYSYAVGAGGSGGTAGTNGGAGGPGAAGQIEVTEYYQ